MISPRKIQEQVKERLALLRNVDEDTIHQAYLAVIFEHLDGARGSIQRLQVLADARKGYHPEKGWILVSREQQEDFKNLCKELEKALSPTTW